MDSLILKANQNNKVDNIKQKDQKELARTVE